MPKSLNKGRPMSRHVEKTTINGWGLEKLLINQTDLHRMRLAGEAEQKKKAQQGTVLFLFTVYMNTEQV
jgi:hypothetical protein